jgi:hypothetical protein
MLRKSKPKPPERAARLSPDKQDRLVPSRVWFKWMPEGGANIRFIQAMLGHAKVGNNANLQACGDPPASRDPSRDHPATIEWSKL